MPVGRPKTEDEIAEVRPADHGKPDKAHVEETLDDAIEDTFPASDPPAATQPGGGRPLDANSQKPERR